jgi:flavin reductase (DIM6/NTAB) family NADH-FMN oxidoreductase RutF
VITSNNYKRGMRRLASAVSIITTQIDGKPAGMTATSLGRISPTTFAIRLLAEDLAHPFAGSIPGIPIRYRGKT